MQPFDQQKDVRKVHICPQHPFSLQIQGTRSAGKTTAILRMLTHNKLLGGMFHYVYFISPTSHLDEKIRRVLGTHTKTVIAHNTALEKAIRHELAEQEKESPASSLSMEKILTDPEKTAGASDNSKTFKLPTIDMKEPQWYLPEVSANWISKLMSQQDSITAKYGKPLTPRVLLVFDDVLGAELIRSTAFKRLVAEGRHHYISTVFSLQNFRSLPKELRVCSNSVMLFPTSNRKEMGVYHEENSLGLDLTEWSAVFDFCTGDDYNFMTILYDNPRRFRVLRCFNDFIDLNQFR